MPDESADQPLVRRLRGVIAAGDEEISVLEARVRTMVSRLDAAVERIGRQDLPIAELERRLTMDSPDPGTPSPGEGTGAKAARKARKKKARQESGRERSKDRKRGGQPGHQGKGLERDPDPDDPQTADPPAGCRSCHGSLDGAGAAEPRWAQVIAIGIVGKVTEIILPGLACAGCGTVTWAPPPGFCAGAVSYGLVLNAAVISSLS